MPSIRKPDSPFLYFNSSPEVKRHGSPVAITSDGLAPIGQ
jgi:hypothetical protein